MDQLTSFWSIFPRRYGLFSPPNTLCYAKKNHIKLENSYKSPVVLTNREQNPVPYHLHQTHTKKKNRVTKVSKMRPLPPPRQHFSYICDCNKPLVGIIRSPTWNPWEGAEEKKMSRRGRESPRSPFFSFVFSGFFPLGHWSLLGEFMLEPWHLGGLSSKLCRILPHVVSGCNLWSVSEISG